jgi:hypothetical protein
MVKCKVLSCKCSLPSFGYLFCLALLCINVIVVAHCWKMHGWCYTFDGSFPRLFLRGSI